ncbi:MAG: chalcone isomerase family protein [Collimonas sp.]|uniref:chalcone isomerase family protein n=1 Tax=Collimonas sp. TaxID=1963772 RepID=UPI0032677854
MTLRMLSVSLLTLLTVGSASAEGSNDAGLKPGAPLFVERAIADARLAGQGSFRWFGLLIYDAQLWVGPKGYQAAAPDIAPFALDLHYARSFDSDSIAETSIEEMKKTGEASDERYGHWLQQMKGLFKNVVKGTHVTGIFMPGYGARFFLDGRALGDITDPQFAHAFFAIWLSPKTSAAGLRKKLLANIKPIEPQ